MPPWRSQNFIQAARDAGRKDIAIAHATKTGHLLQQRTPGAPPIFTLRHLAHLTGGDYSFLRSCVERLEPEPYRHFRIRKRRISSEEKQRYRISCVPDPRLMAVQRWINTNVLQLVPPHSASVAFKKGNNIVEAAKNHCNSRWIIKLDIVNFFESVSEQSVYRVFSGIGYQPLVAFELARLCTRLGQPSYARRFARWESRPHRFGVIEAYQNRYLGHLPQGAPTSPMLANLSMRAFDAAITQIAQKNDLVYTRYADDLTLSTVSETFDRKKAHTVTARIYETLREYGFQPNLAKTKIIPPGARKIVLGVLVDGDVPRLTKVYRDHIRQHLHYMTRSDIGPVQHAKAKGFQSVYGLRNHVRGLIAYAAQIDPTFASILWQQFNRVQWP